MLPHLEVYADLLKLEREVTLRRAERRALLLSALERPGLPPASSRAEPARARWIARNNIMRPLHWVLRLSRA